jgi:RimJ/RimL family protein N-acetyltransferase
LHLETERLLLRPFEERDLDRYAEIVADPETMRYLSGQPMDRALAWRQMAMFLGHFQLRGFTHGALVEKSSGLCIGRAGLLQPEGWPGLEVGWTLHKSARGKGYATEIGRASLDHAFRVLGATRVISIIQPENVKSIRVAERLGETFERMHVLNGQEVAIYGVDRGALP